MKKFLAVLLMLAMLLCGAAFAEDTAPALTKDVVVLFTSDVHCGIDQGWGYAGVANMRNSLQADNHVVLVDDGDAIQGETIGTLRDVLKPNAVCDVYVFNTPRGELMIPALKRVVKTVDVDAGVMTLDSAALAEVAVWEDEPAERDE